MITIQTLYILQDRQNILADLNSCHLSNRGTTQKNNSEHQAEAAHKTLELGYMTASKQTSLVTQTTFKNILVRLFLSDTRKVSPSSEIPQLIIAPHILPHHHQQQNQLPIWEVEEKSNLHCATTATPKKKHSSACSYDLLAQTTRSPISHTGPANTNYTARAGVQWHSHAG